MINCQNCNEELEESQKFCNKCGTRVVPAEVVEGAPRPKRATRSHRLLTIGVVILVGLGIINAQYIGDAYTVFTMSGQSEHIDSIANNSGFNMRGKAIFYRTNPELVDANVLNDHCPHEGEAVEYGCYVTKNNKIYILEVSDSDYRDIEYQSAAHETLHAAWYRMAGEERQSMATSLLAEYNNEKAPDYATLHDLLKNYSKDEAVVVSELHSFIGAQIDTPSISRDDLSEHYSKYFSERWVAVSANTSFETKLKTKAAEIESDRNQLNTLEGDILAYKSQWLDSIQRAMNRDKYYGDYITYNKNVDAYNNNLVNFNRKVDTYNSQRDTFNQKVDKYNAVIQAFHPTRPPIAQDNSTL